MTSPDGILFDLGDTLLRTVSFDLESGIRRLVSLTDQANTVNYAELRQIGDALGVSSEQIRLGSNYEVTFEVFHRNLYKRLGLTCPLGWEILEIEFYKPSLVVECFEGVINTLNLLKSRGIKMAVVSNSSNRGETLEWMLNENGIRHYFEFVMSSADYGFRKPHPEIFETAIARLGIDRRRTWFIGDKPEADIVGAKGVGLTSVWYNADLKSPCDPQPDISVTSWGEFASLIKNCA